MIMNDIVAAINRSAVLGITFHTSPDGDSIGSALALMLGLRMLNKAAYIISKDIVPNSYRFLPNSSEVDGTVVKPCESTDCIIALDCGNKERLSVDFDINQRDCTLINIDHHLSNDNYGDINYVNTKAAAVGEIVHEIIKELKVAIDEKIATCLYTSIITDCGSFKFSNTTSMTHAIAGELINVGIPYTEIHRNIFENKNFNRVKLYGKVIEEMHLELKNKLCVMEINKKMYSELNIDDGDTSDIIALGIEVQGIEVAVLFKERDFDVKVSLRAKDKFDVRKVAEAYGGGGHSKAAGFTIKKSLYEAKSIVIKHIEKELIQWMEF